ncbi:integrase arm-type DNA-binding domain-containing protein [Rhodanobacter sp. C03]|uniref:integrase arm-type DNA-binding domain-containing protein n=1 Tax=Rhodanobacter sp. C03 TaxID=1945858 RepID=UPI0009845F7D|nr:integrase arm-type DNA-binding domain-containing protein [Rhodanobacter sp. C03]
MPLTHAAIRMAKAAEKPQRLYDGGGLYVEVSPAGSKLWRLKYRYGGKEKRLSLGTFPEIGVKEARGKRDAARLMLAEGVDPGEHRKVAKGAGAKGMAEVPTQEQIALPSPTWTRSLEALGVSELEERAYGIVLEQHTATMEDVAAALGLPPNKAQWLLDAIESYGLASHSPERPPRYIAVPPEVAVEALINQRQSGLEKARLAIPKLKSRAKLNVDAEEREQVVEVINSGAVLAQVVDRLFKAVKHEIIGFQRAPLYFPRDSEPVLPGTQAKVVSDASFLEIPGAIESLRHSIEMGEEARTCAVLPFKMLVVDRRLGLINLHSDNMGGAALLVRPSALLDAMCMLFDLVWERATPFVTETSGTLEVSHPSSRLTKAAEQLIPLLAAGLNDKAIAAEMNISAMTLNRRVGELLKHYGIRTRFQLGWHAAMDMYPTGRPQAQV